MEESRTEKNDAAAKAESPEVQEKEKTKASTTGGCLMGYGCLELLLYLLVGLFSC